MKKTQSNRKKHRYDLYSEFNQQKHSSLAHRRKMKKNNSTNNANHYMFNSSCHLIFCILDICQMLD